MADMIPNAPEASNAIETDWHKYKTNGRDRAGRIIKEIYAVEDKYVIYFVDHPYSEPPGGFFRGLLGRQATNPVGLELYYELEDGLVKAEDLAKADAALAGINRLLDAKQEKGSREYNFNFSNLGLAAGALEMVFSHETTEALEILKGIHDKLQAKEEDQRRLMYQAGALVMALVVWFAYLLLRGWTLPPKWEPWILAAALAVAGGLFSVCLNIESLAVNVDQRQWFLFRAGGTRAVIAFLAGAGLLLAMRAKMFGGIAYEKNTPPFIGDPLTGAEMFFCFLAGFSESFVPNILSKTAADKAAEATRKQSEPDEKAKAEAVKKQKEEDEKAKAEAAKKQKEEEEKAKEAAAKKQGGAAS
jgi:hypothetical protein